METLLYGIEHPLTSFIVSEGLNSVETDDYYYAKRCIQHVSEGLNSVETGYEMIEINRRPIGFRRT